MKSWQGQCNDSSSDSCWKMSECTLYALSHPLTLKITFLLPQQQTEGLVPTSLCFRTVPMDPFQPKIQYIFKIILILLILLTCVTILNQCYSTKIKAALTNIFCHGRGMALWMVMSVCGSVQTEISQKLLDWLPWNFINAHGPQRMNGFGDPRYRVLVHTPTQFNRERAQLSIMTFHPFFFF